MDEQEAPRTPQKPKAATRKPQAARRAKTRELLIETAARLFSQSHPDSVTIEDIIQAAGLAKGTFYNHFTDKEALSLEVLRRVLARADAGVAALNIDVTDPAERIARGICFYARLAMMDPVEGRLLSHNAPLDLASDAFDSTGFAPDVGAGIASGRLRVATREGGAVAIVGASWALMFRLLIQPNASAAIFLSQQVGTMTLQGLGLSSVEADALSARCCDEILAGRVAA